jgi:hypothetical protein
MSASELAFDRGDGKRQVKVAEPLSRDFDGDHAVKIVSASNDI